MWSPPCQSAFENVKFRLCSAPVLAVPCVNKPYKFRAEASQVGMGAVLLKEEDGIDRIVLLLV